MCLSAWLGPELLLYCGAELFSFAILLRPLVVRAASILGSSRHWSSTAESVEPTASIPNPPGAFFGGGDVDSARMRAWNSGWRRCLGPQIEVISGGMVRDRAIEPGMSTGGT